MKKGFTLVELSIVLVIIGLLIGGILVAQSMIQTVRVQAVVRQITQYDVLIANFQGKYRQLPGDSNIFTPAGNNDGLIDVNNNGHAYAEVGQVWAELSQSESLKNTLGADYQAFDEVTALTKNHCPQFNLGGSDSHGIPCLFLASYDLGGGAKPYYHYFQINGPYKYSTFSQHFDALKPISALAIDAKIDDGITTGNVVAFVEGDTTSGTCASGTKYDTTDNSYSCSMYIGLGIASGTPPSF